MPKIFLCLFVLIFVSFNFCSAQVDTAQLCFSNSFLIKVYKKIDGVNNKLSRQTAKSLRRFSRQEKQLNNLLLRKDSSFKPNDDKVNQLTKAFSITDSLSDKFQGGYNEYTDTLKSALRFIQQKESNIINLSKPLQKKLSFMPDKITGLDGKFQQAEKIKKYMKERRALLKQQLEKYGLGKQIKKLEKTTYYYGEYVKEYKTLLKDRKKAERKAMSILYSTPFFKKFASQHSSLAGIFRIPGLVSESAESIPALAGIQTRASVQQTIQSAVTAGGPNAASQVKQQIQTGQAALGKFKDRLSRYGSSDAEIPSFKPNSQKTKSFFKRLEYGTNLQFAKSSKLFPSTTNIGLSIGYKLNDKSIAGIGGEYKLGMGEGWNKIKFSTQGFGIRSFMDWKIKGSFFAAGGYELSHSKKLNLNTYLNPRFWEKAGLIGISKKYRVSGKLKGNLQLLYNFLNNKNINRQPIIFRVGYTFK